ncbi:5-methylcytosine methyltransferase [Streptomyces anulatus]|uniref:DNA cytosine methyltransferase n=1 Tax=Streptomyces TaxID=1883 RepID=UPI0006DA390E|nr:MULTISPECIES: DNA cytosine methyltransferase [Streptomyces]KPL34743.1 5-methylcytosine methyltransferase [Streptomyces anulatus]KQX28851.1 5-methylcytosine methyltransferase [Streptomyces sp. Root1295]KRA49898.1 5-methylcytosine methyltransferase [Streptomyces sp. Root63]WTC65670.1 DNA cytosine methyltransferase [Streptomyces anulatus]WTC71320.1 DNA cytosine methyltransferase [Streptomyces anulatus]
MSKLRFVDVCAGAGGLALGFEKAGFDPVLLLDKKRIACETLRMNRPTWNVLEADLLDFDPAEHRQTYDVDLLSAGLPRVKSNATVARVETEEEQRLLEASVLLAHAVQPRALVIENVPGLVDSPKFESIRDFIRKELEHLGYRFRWFVLNAADFGVPQDRKQGVLVALKDQYFDAFEPPAPTVTEHVPVGTALGPSMAARGWPGADAWAAQAISVAPTLVGGSDKRGGADLGPTGSKKAWARMRVNGGTVADKAPGPNDDVSGLIKLTDAQAAILQAFPQEWRFAGKKTARYRQIGHASPPPVGTALGRAVATALKG